MQKLHLVGFTSELDGLILSTRKGAKTGGYVVKLDGAILNAVVDAVPNNGTEKSSAETSSSKSSEESNLPSSNLTPRQMQDRLRAGWSIAEVADAAGVTFDWVSRFAAPVIAEQARVIAKARELVYNKPRFGPSGYPLGSSVRRNIAERGVNLADDEYNACWGAHQVEEGMWIVTFRYTSRGRIQQGEWLVDLDSNELSSRNRLGAQLAYVKGKSRSKPVSTVPSPTKHAPAKRGPAKSAGKKKATPKKATPKKATPKKAAPKKSTPKKAVPKKPVAKKSASIIKEKPVAQKKKKVSPARHVPVPILTSFQPPPRKKLPPPVATVQPARPLPEPPAKRAPVKRAPERRTQASPPIAAQRVRSIEVPQRAPQQRTPQQRRRVNATVAGPVIRAERAGVGGKVQQAAPNRTRRRDVPLSAPKR